MMPTACLFFSVWDHGLAVGYLPRRLFAYKCFRNHDASEPPLKPDARAIGSEISSMSWLERMDEYLMTGSMMIHDGGG